MKNYTFEQKQLLKKIRKNKKERRMENYRNVCIAILLIGIIATPIYCKANRVRKCIVYSVLENKITVQHPNGCLYSFITDNSEQFKENEIITVIFDEFTDWNKNYYIKGVK